MNDEGEAHDYKQLEIDRSSLTVAKFPLSDTTLQIGARNARITNQRVRTLWMIVDSGKAEQIS
jgi:hypothetical protein